MFCCNWGRLTAQVMVTGGLLLGCSYVSAAELTAEQIFEPSKLLQVEIKLPEKDWEALRKQSRMRGGFGNPFSNTNAKPFTYFKGDVTINGVKVDSVGIRKKGFIGSLDETRPSLKVKFSEYVDQKPVEGLDRLTLNNNKQDTALVSQYLSYKIFNDAGVHAPRVSFAKVTVNGKYLGIYSNVESVKKPFLKDRYGDESGNLYEGTLADFYTKAVDKLEAKTDTKPTDDPDVKRLAALLSSDDELPMEEIEKLVDVSSFLKYWAVESLLGFWDGYTQNQNNFFVYDNPVDGRFYFMPWGADSCFSKGGGPFGRFRGGPNSVAIRADAMLPNRLFHSEGIPARYKKSMLQVLKDAWNEEALIAEVDRIEELTEGKLHENQEGRGGGFSPWQRGSLTMDGVRNFIKTRGKQIQSELGEEWPAEVAEKPRKPMYTVSVGAISGSLATTWSDDDEPDEKGRVQDIEFRFRGKEVSLRDITISAHPMQFGGFGRRGPGGRGGREWTPPANIVIKGTRDSDDEPISITLMVSKDDLKKEQPKPLSVSGFLTVGRQQGFGFGRSGEMIQGDLKLSKASVTEGQPIEGKFDIRVVEMRGGMMDRFRGGRDRGGRDRNRGRRGPRPN